MNTWDKVYDEGIANKSTPWQLYGSFKPGNKPYKLKKMFEVFYDKDADEFDSEPLSVPSNIDMSFELFSKTFSTIQRTSKTRKYTINKQT